jgi:hypothetical protein
MLIGHLLIKTYNVEQTTILNNTSTKAIVIRVDTWDDNGNVSRETHIIGDMNEKMKKLFKNAYNVQEYYTPQMDAIKSYIENMKKGSQ